MDADDVDRTFLLDLALHDERRIAQQLVYVGVEEPGEFFVFVFFIEVRHGSQYGGLTMLSCVR